MALRRSPIIALVLLISMFDFSSFAGQGTTYFPPHTRWSAAKRQWMFLAGIGVGSFVPLLWGGAISWYIIRCRPQRHRHRFLMLITALGLGLWFSIFYPLTRGGSSSPDQLGLYAGLCFSSIISLAAVALTLFCLPVDPTKVRGFPVEPKKNREVKKE
jgi:hypothetical protein